jgi:hypothetical protein
MRGAPVSERVSGWFAVIGLVAVFALGACGSDEPSEGSTPASPAAGSPAATATAVANACPAEGCVIEIVDVQREGDELAVTWETNFAPDVSKNHIHVYWDIFSADQVSSDAEDRGVKQGEWVPTDVETYVTGSAVSVNKRGDSTTICVTAGDRDHAVIDSSIVDCQDVSDLL